MSPGRRKQPKTGANIPSGQRIEKGADPNFYRTQTPLWDFGSRDRDHPRWGWSRLDANQFFDLVYAKLSSFQTMTWAEILTASGGRSSGTNSHEVPVANLTREARSRLDTLGILTDTLFSLRLQGTHRVYGVREARTLRVIWFDEDHEIYPTGR